MEKKQKIVQYRERLDRTLASPDLTNDEMLKKLVESQLIFSSETEVEGYKEKVVETKTAEVSNFLDMLRSASSDDSGRSNTSHTDWKLKQDNEEFRVMYCEGPEGTPFHTLLVEGFVDGPLDVCLCISWETSLYSKWWPQSTIPTFKILSCECLHKVQIWEQISLVRVKVSWPLSMREAIVHYYLFEYFQDDLIVVLTNSVPESRSVNGTLIGAIPEAKDVVRVDLVGGFALQKVTSERSYFRTIANMDIKLDFVPPSLINFISRQLIGNGFRLYKKTVASIMSHDEEEIKKTLGDPLYVRIRESLYSTNGSKAKDGKGLKQAAKILPSEDLTERKQDGTKDVSQEDESNQYANNVVSMAMNGIVQDNSKAFGEIVELDSEDVVEIVEDDEEVNDIPNEEINTSAPKGTKSVYISSEVEQALKTLDKAILMVREHKFCSRMASSSVLEKESPHMANGGAADSNSAKLIHPSFKSEVTFEVSNSDTQEGTSQEAPATNSDFQNFRYTGPDSNLQEVNSNKVVPTSPKQNLLRPIEATLDTLENGEATDQTTCSNKQLNTDSVQDMSLDDTKRSSNKKNINTIVPQGMSPDVPKKSNGRRSKEGSSLPTGSKSKRTKERELVFVTASDDTRWLYASKQGVKKWLHNLKGALYVADELMDEVSMLKLL